MKDEEYISYGLVVMVTPLSWSMFSKMSSEFVEVPV
jgi:hypothetical protein